MPTAKLSIVIPVFNRWNFTNSAIKDLSYLDSKTHEIIIVDNASTDETQNGIKEWMKKLPHLSYHLLPENKGFGYACNRGFSKAKNPFVMFLNNDIRVFAKLPNWTDTYLGALEENPNQLISPTGGFIDPKKEFQFAYETEGDKKFNYLSGWMLSGSKKILSSLVEGENEGPFRGDLYFAFFEDGHISFRAKQIGIPLTILSNGAVSHFGHITAKSLNMSRMYSDSRKQFLNQWKATK